MAAPIKTGSYHLQSASNNLYLGFRGNRIVSLPESEDPPVWYVLNAFRSKTVQLLCNGLPVGQIQGNIVTGGEATRWTVSNTVRYPGAVLIEFPKEDVDVGIGRGWVMADPSLPSDVLLRQLVIEPTGPPIYPLTELFVFTPETTVRRAGRS